MDYSRVTFLNSGGITEFLKPAALCETDYSGLAPHCTGPIAEAALVRCLAASSGPALMEMQGKGEQIPPHLPECFDFRRGRLYLKPRPGLGVEFNAARDHQVLEVIEQPRPISLLKRPGGSITSW